MRFKRKKKTDSVNLQVQLQNATKYMMQKIKTDPVNSGLDTSKPKL